MVLGGRPRSGGSSPQRLLVFASAAMLVVGTALLLTLANTMGGDRGLLSRPLYPGPAGGATAVASLSPAVQLEGSRQQQGHQKVAASTKAGSAAHTAGTGPTPTHGAGGGGRSDPAALAWGWGQVQSLRDGDIIGNGPRDAAWRERLRVRAWKLTV